MIIRSILLCFTIIPTTAISKPCSKNDMKCMISYGAKHSSRIQKRRLDMIRVRNGLKYLNIELNKTTHMVNNIRTEVSK